MASLLIVRIFFVFICTIAGYQLGGETPAFAMVLGAATGLGVVFFELFARKISLKGLSSAVFGIMLGLLLAKLFSLFLNLLIADRDIVSPDLRAAIETFITFTFVYLGLTLGLKGKEEFNLVIPYVKFRRGEMREEAIVVDTSSIIDGRILDMVKTGFLEAQFLIPRFVLNELRALADSTDHMKRQKGKRGIEILHTLKKEQHIQVVIYEEEVAGVKSVDEKIVRLAQTMDAKILTTDYNLNRIAQLQGGRVLNINDLANALKPTFIAGERFPLKLIKEGKEHNQAVGYLEDGTMVVVEHARRHIGRTMDVEVTSILQSPSGRIVFTKLAGNR